MIIPINLPSPSSQPGPKFPPQLAKLGTDEVVLLELQGSFEIEGDPSGQLAAHLQMQSENDKPTLRIGHNLLEGKVVNLSKPLAVLAKRTRTSDAGRDARTADGDHMDLDNSSARDSVQDENPEGVYYDIVAVVKRKLLFSRRPMPIVGLSRAATIPVEKKTITADSNFFAKKR